MDLFMDKLSSKSTAQEIIKANTAADVEELNRWKKQAADYSECLMKMHKLVDEGLTKLACSQVETVALGGLVEENAEGIRMLQQDTESFKLLLERLQEQVDSMGSSVAAQLESISRSLEEKEPEAPSAELLERLGGCRGGECTQGMCKGVPQCAGRDGGGERQAGGGH